MQLPVLSLDDQDMSADNLDLIITELDESLGLLVDSILHHKQFQDIEALWRGLHFLVQRTDFSENIMIEILNISKQALLEDLEDAAEINQSRIYECIYTKEFGQFGGKPYSAVVGAYHFTSDKEDVWLLQQMAAIAAMAHAPFISAAAAQVFDIDDFSQLARVRDLQANFEQPKYVKWQALRDSDDARYVALVLPGFILRSIYNSNNAIDIFNYHETFSNAAKPLWGNAASRLPADYLQALLAIDGACRSVALNMEK